MWEMFYRKNLNMDVFPYRSTNTQRASHANHPGLEKSGRHFSLHASGGLGCRWQPVALMNGDNSTCSLHTQPAQLKCSEAMPVYTTNLAKATWLYPSHLSRGLSSDESVGFMKPHTDSHAEQCNNNASYWLQFLKSCLTITHLITLSKYFNRSRVLPSVRRNLKVVI